MSRNDSDDDDFQVLTYEQIELQQPGSPQKYVPGSKNQNSSNNQKGKNQHQYANPTLSCIRLTKQLGENNFKIQIAQSQNIIDMNFLQNQFYVIKISKNSKIIKENIKRRYSDFDLLFQILEKKYSGFIFPAFPQKGLVSYVKSKVSVTKDQLYMKNRIKMIERFFNTILNEEKFNIQKCTQMRKFFSKDEQHEIFKKTSRQQLNRSKNIVDSTWSFVKNYFKLSQTSKYTSVIEQIKKQKQPFEQLALKTNQVFGLIKDELQANRALCSSCQITELSKKLFSAFPQFKKLVQNYTQELQPVAKQLSELQFSLFCENEDFIMVLKKIQMIQHMKESESNYKNLTAIEDQFLKRRGQIQADKQIKLDQLKKKFKELVQRVKDIEKKK